MRERNIQALQLRRQREDKEAAVEERVAEAITRFTGSMRFVYLHLAFFGCWILANLGWVPGVPALGFLVRRPGDGRLCGGDLPLDFRADQPEPHGRGGRQAGRPRPADQPARGRLVTLVSGIADRMGVETEADADLEEITEDVAPEAVLDELEATEPGAEQH